MKDNADSIINEKKMSQTNKNKKESIKKINLIQKIEKLNLSQKQSKIINFILIEIISILLPKAIFSKNFMEIKVNKMGYNQIISDDYNDTRPSRVIVNNLPILMKNKKVYIESINDLIYLEWPDDETEINVVSMFRNLDSIISVNMNIFGKNGNLSYMFYNCKNLEEFSYSLNYDKSYSIQDMRSMFYNCSSLLSFNFSYFYLGKYTTNLYHNVNFSYMFYNCYSLESIYIGSSDIGNIIDMKGMFHNCISITSIDLTNIYARDNVDISYMFYNCSKLESFTSNTIFIKDMKYMFYNCSLLNNITMSSFRNFMPSNYINMSNVFYNCYNLESLQGKFSGLYISDVREMFYNCISLLSLNFNPKGISKYINMSKMFYNCTNLKSTNLNNNHLHIFPTDLSYIFYNCISLTSLAFNYFKTDYLEEIIINI